MTDRELLKEARDLIVMCSLLDKSNQCNEMVDKMDKQLAIPLVSRRSELYFAFMEEYNALMGESEYQILKEEVVVLLAKYCG